MTSLRFALKLTADQTMLQGETMPQEEKKRPPFRGFSWVAAGVALVVLLGWTWVGLPQDANQLVPKPATLSNGPGASPSMGFFIGVLAGQGIFKPILVVGALILYMVYFSKKTFRVSGSIVLILAVYFLIYLVPIIFVAKKAEDRAKVAATQAATVQLCDVLQRPGLFIGKTVYIEAKYGADRDGRVWLQDSRCTGGLPIGPDMTAGASTSLAKFGQTPASKSAASPVNGHFSGLIVRIESRPDLYPNDHGVRLSLSEPPDIQITPAT